VGKGPISRTVCREEGNNVQREGDDRSGGLLWWAERQKAQATDSNLLVS
jgi:hypothetical protein